MKILTVVGARPQFIKAAAVSRKIEGKPEISETLLHTGQHFDSSMSQIFFEEMEIPEPKYNLGINNLRHGAMTGQMLEGIEDVILKECPDLVMVYGDTNSTLAGALAARKMNIRVAHVEAGLRSFNMEMPEEINRILTDRISDLLFCPTDVAVINLEKEGFPELDKRVCKTGDVMQDAAHFYAEKSSQESDVIDRHNLQDFILCTFHRSENTDHPDRLRNILDALNEIHQTVEVLLPLHPRTKKMIKTSGNELKVKAIDPVGYFDMIELLKHCKLVITDSGGLQKEAFFFRKNCVTLRDQTEWVELVTNNVSVLAGAAKKKIVECTSKMMDNSPDFDIDLYGGGKASKKIVEEIMSNQ